MKTIFLILIFGFIILVLFLSAAKNRNKEESKLSVFDHQSTFKKPEIEMVNTPPQENKNTDNSFYIDPKEPGEKSH